MTLALAILLAFDEALFNGVVSYNPKVVVLEKLMTEWLGPITVAKLVAATQPHADMKSFWEDGEIFCNHFTRVQIPPDEDALLTTSIQGMGILLPDSFPGCDILIPVKIAKQTMSFIVISVKNGSWDVPGKSMRNLAKSSIDDAVKSLGIDMVGRPYFSMMAALRSKSDTPAKEKFVVVEQPAKSSKKAKRKSEPDRLILLAVSFNDKL